jgi:transposase
VISVEDWAEIRRLHRAEGMPVRAVARKLGVGRNTVRRALAAEGPPRYQRPPKGSVADAVEPRVRELLAQWPDMPATVIAERIGWDRSLTVLKVRVRELRIDRLVHHAEVIALKGDSYRLKDKDLGRVPAANTSN